MLMLNSSFTALGTRPHIFCHLKHCVILKCWYCMNIFFSLACSGCSINTAEGIWDLLECEEELLDSDKEVRWSYENAADGDESMFCIMLY